MTAIEVPPTWQASPITRSIDHRYTYEGITYPGVTGIIDIVGGSFAQASGWGAKMTAQAAVRLVKVIDPNIMDEADHQSRYDFSALEQMFLAVGPAGVEKALKSRDSWGPDPSGSVLGNKVHEAISRWLNTGWETTEPSTFTRVRHFTEWWQASGWKLRLSEAIVLHPAKDHEQDGWGGTIDILAYDRDGRTVLADIKTGNIYPKVALQLAAYGLCSLVQPEGSQTVYPMPLPERYVTLHVTRGGCREIEMSIGTAERMAFLSALDIYHWSQSMKGKKL